MKCYGKIQQENVKHGRGAPVSLWSENSSVRRPHSQGYPETWTYQNDGVFSPFHSQVIKNLKSQPRLKISAEKVNKVLITLSPLPPNNDNHLKTLGKISKIKFIPQYFLTVRVLFWLSLQSILLICLLSDLVPSKGHLCKNLRRKYSRVKGERPQSHWLRSWCIQPVGWIQFYWHILCTLSESTATKRDYLL